MNNTGKKNMGVLLNTGTPATGLSFGYKPKPKLEVKWKRLLRELIDRTLNRFDAERHGDHCLNSAIADLRRDQLVSISWNWEEVPSMGGRAMARVKRYWVSRDEVSMRHARGLLEMT